MVGTGEADYIIGIREEERKKIFKALKEREEEKRMNLDPYAKIEPVYIDKSFYEIMQLITDKAKNYPLPTRHQLERIGGSVIG